MKLFKEIITYFSIGVVIALIIIAFTGCSTTQPHCSNGYEKCVQRKGNEVCYCQEYK